MATIRPLPHLLLAVAHHPNTPLDVLEQLSGSPVPTVRERARSRLAARN